MKYGDLTEKIIGCAMQVHSHLGNGFQEVIYQRALEVEMNLQKIAFEREMEMSIFYKTLILAGGELIFLSRV
jgi:GxxExxY protein